MKIIILTEVGHQIGFGHLTRCLSFAQVGKKKGIESVFYLETNECDFPELNDFLWEKKSWWNSLENISIESSDIVIVDSYHAKKELYSSIREITKNCLWLDDNQRIVYPEGFLLNSIPCVSKSIYSEIHPEKCFVGPHWHVMRKDFWDVSRNKTNSDIKNVLINFGGSDIRNLSIKIIKPLLKHFPDWKWTIVLGSGILQNNLVFPTSENISIKKSLSGKEMLLQMKKSDIAITGGGQTIFELARLGIPSFLIALIDNQFENVKNWHELEAFRNVGFWDDENLIIKLIDEIELFQSKEKRLILSSNSSKLVDGSGASRVLEEILKNGYGLL